MLITTMSAKTEESVKEEIFNTFDAIVRIRWLAAVLDAGLNEGADMEALIENNPELTNAMAIKQAVSHCPEMFHLLIKRGFDAGKKFKKE